MRLVVFIRAPKARGKLRRKLRTVNKMSARIQCQTIKNGIYYFTIISLFSILILVCEIYPTALSVHLLIAVPSPTPKIKRKGGNFDENLTLIMFCDVTLLQENI